MNDLNGGYVMINLNTKKDVLLQQLEKALLTKRPIMVYSDDNAEYMELRKDNLNNCYILENSNSIVYFKANMSRPYKTSKIVKGTTPLDFIGTKNIIAEIKEGYIDLTIVFWNSDENQNDISITANDTIIAQIDFGANNPISNSIQLGKYTDFYGIYDEDGEVITDSATLTASVGDDGVYTITANDDFTFERVSTLIFNVKLYRNNFMF